MELLKPLQSLEKPPPLTLADIAREPCPALQSCLLIMHSQRTSAWEKTFAQAAYGRQLWRLEHHWQVPPDQRAPSAKEMATISRVLTCRKLDRIDFADYLPLVDVDESLWP